MTKPHRHTTSFIYTSEHLHTHTHTHTHTWGSIIRGQRVPRVTMTRQHRPHTHTHIHDYAQAHRRTHTWGSIIRGQRVPRVTITPFSVEKESEGRP